jgi:hypothetical protein
MKRINSTKPKYKFLFKVATILTNFLHWSIMPFHLEVIISFYCVPKEIGKLLMTTPLDKLKLELQVFKKKQPWSRTQLKSWKKMARIATIWGTCLYQHFGFSFNPSLSMWSLPNLPCAKFWDSLRLNIASTLCFSWRATL